MFGDSHAFQDAGSSDSSLLAALATGDAREAELALERLHQRYHAELWRFAYTIVRNRDNAEDVVQDAFVALWHRRAQLDASKSIRAYLYGVVRNGALMQLRSGRIEARATEQLLQGQLPEPLAEPVPTDRPAEIADAQRHVTTAINTLTERQRTAVTLRWLRGLPYDEVASAMGISRQAVDALLQRTYTVLRAALAPLKNNSP